MNAFLVFIKPTLISALVAYIVSKVVIKEGNKLKIIDDPAKHIHPKVTHVRPVPRGGGIPILGAVMVGGILFLPHNTQTAGIIAGCLILATVGFLDDRFEEKISPYTRLIINILAAICVIGVGIGIAYITSPWGGGIIHFDTPQWCFNLWGNQHCLWLLSDLFALLWLVWMQNIVGWSSGVDGQLPGFVIVAATTIAILATRFPSDSSQIIVISLAGVIAGAYAGFLPWNWFPQKIMPGYGGKSLAGFLLGILAILSGAKVGAMVMVLGIPFIDAVLVIFKRIREGRSPVWGGREHLHHYLLDRGWSKTKIASFYWFMSILLAVLALQLKAELKYFTMATVILVISGTILWVQTWSTYSKPPGPDNG